MAAKKKPTKDVSPRQIGRNVMIWSKDYGAEMNVKDVRVILRFDNGFEEAYNSDEMVKVLDPQPTMITDDKVVIGND